MFLFKWPFYLKCSTCPERKKIVKFWTVKSVDGGGGILKRNYHTIKRDSLAVACSNDFFNNYYNKHQLRHYFISLAVHWCLRLCLSMMSTLCFWKGDILTFKIQWYLKYSYCIFPLKNCLCNIYSFLWNLESHLHLYDNHIINNIYYCLSLSGISASVPFAPP